MTHTVMPMGSHTSRPVMKYCLKLRFFMRAIGEGRDSVKLNQRQWQAQEAAQAPALLEVVEEEVEVASPPVETAGAGDATASAVAAAAGTAVAAEPPPLKSVAYQPVPLSWKPGAVSCLLNLGAPQTGQSVRASSLIFCKTSLAWPQASHL
jgi:hypothetical protein